MKRGKRTFGASDADRLSRQLRAGHRIVIQWMSKTPIDHPVYRSLYALSEALHSAADAACGKPGALSQSGHKTPHS